MYGQNGTGQTHVQTEEKLHNQAEMLRNRLAKRFKHLSKWAQRTGSGAFRLYDRDIPEIPLILDYYKDARSGDCISGALYQRPYEKDPNEELIWLDEMKSAVAAALGLDRENIFIKIREHQRGAEQYGKQANSAVTRIIEEAGLRFRVNLSDYLDTGLFPDRRPERYAIRQEASDKKILNLFCYTGSFSVAAAAGGAASTCSVDMSNTYLGWAQENFSLNKIKSRIADMGDYWVTHTHKAHTLVRADALVFLKQAQTRRCTWDTIILDPPSFSNSKKMSGYLDLRRDYLRLLEQCLALLADGGKIWFSANAKSFKEDAPSLEAELRQKHQTVRVTDMTRRLTDEDFRDRSIPRTFLIVKQEGLAIGNRNREEDS